MQRILFSTFMSLYRQRSLTAAWAPRPRPGSPMPWPPLTIVVLLDDWNCRGNTASTWFVDPGGRA